MIAAPARWGDGQLIRNTELIRFKPGVDPAGVEFETGYAAAATDSYETFRRLRTEGVIGRGVRFQVSLPTPMASGYMYLSPNSLDDYLPVYERALTTALDQILQAVPHDELTIQWDICQEVLIYEDYFPARPPGSDGPKGLAGLWYRHRVRLGRTDPSRVPLITAQRVPMETVMAD